MGPCTNQTGDLVKHRAVVDALVAGDHCPARNGTSDVIGCYTHLSLCTRSVTYRYIEGTFIESHGLLLYYMMF